ncbi:23S rRNA pseudouridine(1911/1915/1917) synthase RluD [Cardiobacterium valvarum]|uniref:Pseudouridine synthase n=1 Tax=Cardiobacterium valvarum F0432 TaxID=797473 RepID=G9ZJK3_9GAMM|nr:23S rRNA pseudouridine(1911/1915/1917) synthase RluD [Cardiobacterium valvarum]EHM49724.1 putative ribosomal large subunit pseudouridine synthase D [Cardiobacterium valvarum F0432]
MTTEPYTLNCTADEDIRDWRLDQFLAHIAPDYSRSRWQTSIKAGLVQINGNPARAKDHVYPGDNVRAQIAVDTETAASSQDIPLNIIHADADIIVIDKPAGLVVHPAAGNPDGTLLNALLHHFPETAQLPRGGIVHRLDKDTSGLLVIARNLRAHAHLVRQLQERSMGRTYLALCYRYITAGGTIDQPLGRHPRDRLKMAIREDGKDAVTHYRIEERYGDIATLLRVNLETGRTHQIRVHLAAQHNPLVGDPLYGLANPPGKGIAADIRQALIDFPRQALHAAALTLHHPADDSEHTYASPLPADMAKLLDTLRNAYPAN